LYPSLKLLPKKGGATCSFGGKEKKRIRHRDPARRIAFPWWVRKEKKGEDGYNLAEAKVLGSAKRENNPIR